MLRLQQVLELLADCGVADGPRLVHRQGFPRPARIGEGRRRSLRWFESEVDAWLAVHLEGATAAPRPAGAPKPPHDEIEPQTPSPAATATRSTGPAAPPAAGTASSRPPAVDARHLQAPAPTSSSPRLVLEVPVQTAPEQPAGPRAPAATTATSRPTDPASFEGAKPDMAPVVPQRFTRPPPMPQLRTRVQVLELLAAAGVADGASQLQAAGFPRPLRFGDGRRPLLRWIEAEVEAWLAVRLAGAAAAPRAAGDPMPPPGAIPQQTKHQATGPTSSTTAPARRQRTNEAPPPAPLEPARTSPATTPPAPPPTSTSPASPGRTPPGRSAPVHQLLTMAQVLELLAAAGVDDGARLVRSPGFPAPKRFVRPRPALRWGEAEVEAWLAARLAGATAAPRPAGHPLPPPGAIVPQTAIPNATATRTEGPAAAPAAVKPRPPAGAARAPGAASARPAPAGDDATAPPPEVPASPWPPATGAPGRPMPGRSAPLQLLRTPAGDPLPPPGAIGPQTQHHATRAAGAPATVQPQHTGAPAGRQLPPTPPSPPAAAPATALQPGAPTEASTAATAAGQWTAGQAPRLLTQAEVQARLKAARVFYRQGFPGPVRTVGIESFWAPAEVNAWFAAREAEAIERQAETTTAPAGPPVA